MAELRERAGLRQTDVARALCVSTRTIMRLENGQVILRPALQYELARLYRVAPELITKLAARRYQQRLEELIEIEAYMHSEIARSDSQ